MARYTPPYLAGAAERARARQWGARPFPAAYVFRREARAEQRALAAVESLADRRRSAVAPATGRQLVTLDTAAMGFPIASSNAATFALVVAVRVAFIRGAALDTIQLRPATVAAK